MIAEWYLTKLTYSVLCQRDAKLVKEDNTFCYSKLNYITLLRPCAHLNTVLCEGLWLQWVISELATYNNSCVIVALYDTLGVDARTFIIKQCDIQLVICDNEKKAASTVFASQMLFHFLHYSNSFTGHFILVCWSQRHSFIRKYPWERHFNRNEG